MSTALTPDGKGRGSGGSKRAAAAGAASSRARPGSAAATSGSSRRGLLRRRGGGSGGSGGKAPGRRRQQLAQIRQAYAMTKRVEPRIGLLLAGCFLAVFLVFLLIGLWLDHPVYFGLLGALSGLLLVVVVFGRRAQRAAYAQVEGQLGAAASVLQTLRRGWTVTPTVAVTRQQDVVHRVVGRPGVILVAEGARPDAGGRLAGLLAQEKKRLARVLPDVPVYDMQAGSGDGQVPLRRLQKEVTKLPRNLRPAQVAEIDRRLRAMGTLNLPIPKGPMPRGARMPRNPGSPRAPR